MFGVLGVFLFSGHFTAAIDLNISSTGMLRPPGRLDSVFFAPSTLRIVKWKC